ncbi:VOC family protein [Thalassiella azotivora]
MTSRISAISLVAVDPARVGAFWSAALGWPVTEVDDEGVSLAPPDGSWPAIDVIRAPDGKTGKNRVHLDLRADGTTTQAELDRLLSLGARRVDVGQPDDATWVVLADPEGNELCLLSRTVQDVLGGDAAGHAARDATAPGPRLVPFAGGRPVLHPESWVAPDVALVGAVTLDAGSSVWFGSVLRADDSPIHLGEGSNLQDGCVVHPGRDLPVTVGRRVSVGHRAVLHGCTVEDDVLVGMGAVVLNGARIGRESLVAAGAVVREGTVVPPRSLVTGVPAAVKREVTGEEVERIHRNAETYVALAARYRDGAGH